MNTKPALLIFILLISTLYFCENATEPKNVIDIDTTANYYPECKIISPDDSSSFYIGDTISISINAKDDSSGLNKVSLKINKIINDTTLNFPFEYSWNTQNIDEGEYEILAIAENNDSLFTSDTIMISLVEPNAEPVADFSIYPEQGDIFTIFQFDTTNSSDDEDANDQLKVRFDWESDGEWDTEFRKNKSIIHQFTYSGEYTISCQVKDSNGSMNVISKTISVNESSLEHGTITDNEGNVYKTVKIGNQWWMAENLRTMHYNSGEKIATGAYAYNDDMELAKIYGMLYSREIKNIAPEGWRFATNDDWQELEKNIGMDIQDAEGIGWRGTSEGSLLKSIVGWQENGNGSNKYGLNILPSGKRKNDGSYSNLGYYTYFWDGTAEPYAGTVEYGCRQFSYKFSEIGRMYWSYWAHEECYPIRCIRIEPGNTPPNASFTIDSVGSTYLFDASSCYDREDETDALKVSWDWEDDGIWDTAYSFNKYEEYDYNDSKPGDIRLEVIDTGGAVDDIVANPYVGSLIDVDGNIYKTVKINDQWWMAENLKVQHYRNGKSISNVMVFNNDESNAKKYGRLYNWSEVDLHNQEENSEYSIAPEGWHVPSKEEFEKLFDYVGHDAGKLKSTTDWDGYNGSDDYGFNVLPAGNYSPNWGFNGLHGSGYFWSSSPTDDGRSYHCHFRYDSNHIGILGQGNRSYYFSIRCVKDD